MTAIVVSAYINNAEFVEHKIDIDVSIDEFDYLPLKEQCEIVRDILLEDYDEVDESSISIEDVDY